MVIAFARRRGEERASGHVFPSASEDEQGGYQARNAASGASNPTPLFAGYRKIEASTTMSPWRSGAAASGGPR
jgi:hypothetical protein